MAQKLRSLLGERDQKFPCLSFGKSTSLEVLSQTQVVAEPSPSRNGHRGSCRRAQQAGMLGRCGLVEGGYVNPEMNPYNRGQSPHFQGRALQPGRGFSRKVPGSLRVTPKAKPKLCSLLTKHPTSTKGPLVRIATLGVRGGRGWGVLSTNPVQSRQHSPGTHRRKPSVALSHQEDLVPFEAGSEEHGGPGKVEQPIQGLGLGYRATWSH